ncbi:hypothetical protein PIB30_053531 [Stylosanthes scabra]|uniref:Uncharacterized protein n=1 Tax=Stylosanthes scabra TaxID=79078 RepID=A0ABU6WLW1_9FABA|nr:hypothetical protein [Stylosanthes scabra]
MRKKLAARRGRYTFPNKATHHTIHIDIDTPNPNSEETAAASPSPSQSPTRTHSPSHTQEKMARTKTTNRYTGAEINAPSTRSTQTRASREPTPPQEQPSPPPPPTSARPSSSRGKRPRTEEAAPPPPPRPRGSGYRSLLYSIVESDEARPPLYKSFYDERRNVYLDAERIGEILGYTDDGLTVYTSGKWNPALNLSYHDALVCICTRISLSDSVTPTHKSLGPIYAQLHRIITHIILPTTSLLMCFGGGAVKRAAKRDLRAERRVLEEKERRARASTSRSSKSKGSGIKLLVTVVRELIQEVINMASCTSTAMEKSKSRARVLEKYLNKLEDDHLFSEPEDEEDEEEHQDSQEEDDSDAN